MLDRKTQIELIEGAEERAQAHFREWLANPIYRAEVHKVGGHQTVETRKVRVRR